MLSNEILVGTSRKHCRKRRKCGLPAFSAFPTMFSKAFLLGKIDRYMMFHGASTALVI